MMKTGDDDKKNGHVCLTRRARHFTNPLLTVYIPYPYVQVYMIHARVRAKFRIGMVQNQWKLAAAITIHKP